MDLRQLLSKIRKACQDYNMIQDGDKIAVACSGGKDSLALALAMKEMERFYPCSYHMKAFTVSIGFPDMDYSGLETFMRDHEIPFEIIPTQIKQIVFDVRKEKNPCSLCASMRKGALYQVLQSEGYHKCALGHHREDVVETFLMSLLLEGRIHTFQPVTHLSRTGIDVLRPMIYVPEKEIVHFSGLMKLPVLKNTCPMDGSSSRQDAEDLLKQLNRKDHQVTERIFHAIQASDMEGWYMPPYRKRKKGSAHELQ